MLISIKDHVFIYSVRMPVFASCESCKVAKKYMSIKVFDHSNVTQCSHVT